MFAYAERWFYFAFIISFIAFFVSVCFLKHRYVLWFGSFAVAFAPVPFILCVWLPFSAALFYAELYSPHKYMQNELSLSLSLLSLDTIVAYFSGICWHTFLPCKLLYRHTDYDWNDKKRKNAQPAWGESSTALEWFWLEKTSKSTDIDSDETPFFHRTFSLLFALWYDEDPLINILGPYETALNHHRNSNNNNRSSSTNNKLRKNAQIFRESLNF